MLNYFINYYVEPELFLRTVKELFFGIAPVGRGLLKIKENKCKSLVFLYYNTEILVDQVLIFEEREGYRSGKSSHMKIGLGGIRVTLLIEKI